jgi:site-specific DNA-methyltransferase (adenine-specific)
MEPYWTDGQVTLYLGDCREVTEWLAGDVLVTDPPYGRGWGQHGAYNSGLGHKGITGDRDTDARDSVLLIWAPRPAVVFGDLMLAPPVGNKQTLVYAKSPNSGVMGSVSGFRRDVEAIYLMGGDWPLRTAQWSAVVRTNARGPLLPHRYGHPHAKPVDVMETLIAACPDGVIADPFAGSGSTLIAARNQGRQAIGVEIDERYCEITARRLDQGILIA